MQARRILAITSDFQACGNWRIIQPFKRPLPDAHVHFEVYAPNTTFALSSYDGLLVQRPDDPMRVKLVEQAKKRGKMVFIDIDDRLPVEDPSHNGYRILGPDAPAWKNMRHCMELADGLLVSTPQLQEHYRAINPRIAVAMNAIDPGSPIYQKRFDRYPQLAGKTVMYWSGQIWGHAQNLAMIKPAVQQAVAQVPDLVLMMCGPKQLFGIFDLPAERVLNIEPLPFETYMRLGSMADFTLAPLLPSAFNDCKSEVRILESAAWSVPCIASPAAPYRRFHDLSKGACLLIDDNASDLWRDQIIRLARDVPFRRQLGECAHKAVESEYDLEAINRVRESFVINAWASQ